MKLERIPFGKTAAGELVDKIYIENSSGTNCSLISYGATLTSFRMADKRGNFQELCLGFDDLSGYEAEHPYFGATVGRVANRIKKAEFSLENTSYKLDCNAPPHHLHGGSRGFSRRVWEIFPIKREKEAGACFQLSSEDGDQGYPGNLDISLTVMLSEKNELSFSYRAACDKATPVSLTNHSYWNLSGACSGSVEDHLLSIGSEWILEVDRELIPTGRKMNVINSPFDFRTEKRIGKDIEEAGGYDHCYLLNPENALSIPAAVIRDEGSGRCVKLLSTSPAMQLYSANFLSGEETRDGRAEARTAFCLETQEYTDAVHHENFPSVILWPGEEYERKTVMLFSVE